MNTEQRIADLERQLAECREEKEYKRKRKRSAWPALRALKPTGAVT